MSQNIVILGSTGSIGTQTLTIVDNNPELKVIALSANSKVDMMEMQVRKYKPLKVCMYNEDAAIDLAARIKDTDTKVVSGMDGLIEISTMDECDTVVTAIVGMIGIRPTIAAIKAGKIIALANKETLVTAGHIIMPLCREMNVPILPVDSEHSAIFQSMQGMPKNRIEKILLTCSGGPFRGKTYDELKTMTPEKALKHPNWSMGSKITIDSASLVNKGLEIIEAKWLFDTEIDNIQVVVHPQSIIHSMVQYVDGGIMAQLGTPDMCLPIQYALFYPDRKPMNGKRVDFFDLKELTFFEPDKETFLGLKYAIEAGKKGGSLPTVFNAANERAVALFLKGQIGFTEIYDIIRMSMDAHKFIENPTVEEILQSEAETYELIATKY
jgi:1-deoxy-D-xylulose-5-phosphate reductoisomerase